MTLQFVNNFFNIYYLSSLFMAHLQANIYMKGSVISSEGRKY